MQGNTGEESLQACFRTPLRMSYLLILQILSYYITLQLRWYVIVDLSINIYHPAISTDLF